MAKYHVSPAQNGSINAAKCIVLLALLITCSHQFVLAQNIIQVAQASPIPEAQIQAEATSYPFTVSGQVIDHEGIPLSFAIVMIYEGDIVRFGAQTNEDGKFRLTIDWDQKELGKLELVARYMGQQTERMRLKAKALQNLLIEFPAPPKIDCICTPLISHYPLEYRGSGISIVPAYGYMNWEFEQW